MIIFSDHSLIKLEQRGLNKDLVIATVKKPDYSFESRLDRKIAYKKFGSLYLRVVFIQEKNNLLIITQHWREKVREIN